MHAASFATRRAGGFREAEVAALRRVRGDGQDINAVIWFCDLRDSTPLADSMSRQAFLAPKEAMARMEKLNQSRLPPLRFGIGLHLGDVMYGNIGTPTRIEFTVIGAAANEAARIESLCKKLGADLVLSAPVARQLPEAWKPLGRHALRGVGNEIELFTL